MSKYGTVAIVGVGLIGGSLGMALRERGLAQQVVGIGRRRSSLDRAQAVGAVDKVSTQLAEGLREAELAIVGTPVDSVVETVLATVVATSSLRWITDVGSTKAEICRTLDDKLPAAGKIFVGSHPLAGDHRSGPENARPNLFEGRKVVVTPTNQTPAHLTAEVRSFWEDLGAEVISMNPADHDRTLAITSHLPHLVASALADCTPRQCLPLAATGWADTTRVAAGDPHLWTQIFSHNAAAMLEPIDNLVELLQHVRTQLEDSDWKGLEDFLERAKQTRDALGN